MIFCILRVRQNFDKSLPIVDPDPGKCYSKAKRMKCNDCSEKESSTAVNQAPQLETLSVQGNWSIYTSCLPPLFSYINIVNYAKKSGRSSSSYVEKPLEKGYKFFYENYLFDVLSLASGNEVHVKGKCYHSQRKSLSPHSVIVRLSMCGDVNSGKCSCAAGINGYCNHAMALLYLIDHVNKIKAQSFPVVGTCTENPQQWHKPRTQGIVADPIMGYTVSSPKYAALRPGLKCTLYEARHPAVINNDGAAELQKVLAEINPSLGFCTNFTDKLSTESIKLNQTRVPVGSVLSYQLSFTEGNFEVLTSLPPISSLQLTTEEYFPSLPHVKVPAVGLQMPLI